MSAIEEIVIIGRSAVLMFGRLTCGKPVQSVQNSCGFDWDHAKASLRERLGVEAVSRWLDPLCVVSSGEAGVVLEAPNPYFRDWVSSHYLEAIQHATGGRTVRLVIANAWASASPAQAAGLPIPPPPPEARRSETPARAPSSGEGRVEGLTSKLTFDRFVVGPSNRFAHAASLAVAESPAKAYNPLFLYGGVGLGKTHLMQAIGHAILKRAPGRRVVYVSSERFTNELISAIQTKTTARFRDRYRTSDALLVDDIHFIAQKEATQEEFFHTFNTLYDAHKQIVISSDRSPKDIAGLEERLVSRFAWGLVTDVQPPDLETRIAILRKKAEESGVCVPDEVTEFIARQVTSNIRELEGALIRVVAYCNLFNVPASAATARDVLKDMVQEARSRVTIGVIQQRVAAHFRIELEEIRGVSRQRSILYPRQVAMFLCRRLTDASLPEIGRAFGGRDHTTVMHAVEKIAQESAQDAHKQRRVAQLQALVVEASS